METFLWAPFEAIGEDFEHLERSRDVIAADVLDAWFPPAPGVLHALEEHLPWLVRTSPTTNCPGMLRAIARVRGIPGECIVPGAGSFDLIFLTFRKWPTPASRVLILDPSYREYAHVLERLVRCRADRLTLLRRDGYVLDPSRLEGHMAAGYDLIVLVNPNNPTGRHLRRHELEEVLAQAPARTRVWLDETYVEYAGGEESFERVAAASGNVIVCKSMSKVYALSGLRAAYLCAPAPLAQELRSITPPWAVSVPANQR